MPPLQKEKHGKEGDLQKAQQIAKSAILAEENTSSVRKLWKEISKDMQKAVKERKKKHKYQKLLFTEISGFILSRSHYLS